MYRLYDYPLSGNGYKVRLLLSQLEVPFDYVELDILKGETRTAEFLAKNPNGRIPLLELEPGSFLAESLTGDKGTQRHTAQDFETIEGTKK